MQLPPDDTRQLSGDELLFDIGTYIDAQLELYGNRTVVSGAEMVDVLLDLRLLWLDLVLASSPLMTVKTDGPPL
jgi:hypothetical protein